MTRAGRIKRGARKAGEGRARQNIVLESTLEALKQPVLCEYCHKFPRMKGGGNKTPLSYCVLCHLDGVPQRAGRRSRKKPTP